MPMIVHEGSDVTISATSEGGMFIGQPVAYDTNTGTLLPISSGIPSNPTDSWVVELVVPGNMGAANFKYSLNGGAFQGRKAITGAFTKQSPSVVTTAYGTQRASAIQTRDGTVVCVYQSASDSISYKRSMDRLTSWGSTGVLFQSATSIQCGNLCQHFSGRIFLKTSYGLFASDDSGASWELLAIEADALVVDSFLLPSRQGVLWYFYTSSNEIFLKVSYNQGMTWDTPQNLTSGITGNQTNPTAVELSGGNILLFYTSTEDGNAKLRFSTYDVEADSWTHSSTVIVGGDYPIQVQSATQDVSGRVYVFYRIQVTNYKIRCAYSDDNGITWNPATNGQLVYESSGLDVFGGFGFIYNGFETGVVAQTGTSPNIDTFITLNGEPEAFSGPNSIPVAPHRVRQYLTNGVSIEWAGSKGKVPDGWNISSEFDYKKENAFIPGAGLPVRSNGNTNQVWNLDLDFGIKRGANPDYFTFFGINGIEEILIQLDNDNSRFWGPSLVQNGNMEHVSSTQSSFWVSVGTPLGISKELIYFFDGKTSLRIQHDTDGSANYRKQVIALEANAWYYWEVQARGRTATQANVRVGFNDITGGYVDTASLTTAWTKVSVVFQNIGATGNYDFVCRKTNAASFDVLMDGVKIHKIPDATGYSNRPWMSTFSSVKLYGWAEGNSSNNQIYAPTMLSDVEDHSLSGFFLKIIYDSLGLGRDGYCYTITDNTGDYLTVENDDINDYIITNTTITVLDNRVNGDFEIDALAGRYLRTTIPPQRTVNDFYSIGVYCIGNKILIPVFYGVTLLETINISDVEVIHSSSGQPTGVESGPGRKQWILQWKNISNNDWNKLKNAWFMTGRGRYPILLVPYENETPYLAFFTSAPTEDHFFGTKRPVELRFEEVV